MFDRFVQLIVFVDVGVDAGILCLFLTSFYVYRPSCLALFLVKIAMGAPNLSFFSFLYLLYIFKKQSKTKLTVLKQDQKTPSPLPYPPPPPFTPTKKNKLICACVAVSY